MNGQTNTDKLIWREPLGDYYSASIHVTEDGGIGIEVDGLYIVKPIREWHAAVQRPAATQEQPR